VSVHDASVALRQVPGPPAIATARTPPAAWYADAGLVSGPVTDVVFVGSTTHVRVAVADRELQIVVPNDGAAWIPAPGTRVGVDVPSEAVRVLSR
jgi:hypothetical protein